MLIRSNEALLLIVDVQERLAPAIFQAPRLTANIVRLLTAARRLEVPVLASEQYPRGLGATLPELSALIPDAAVFEKICFSCMDEPGFSERLAAAGRRQIVVTGMEAHVCVLQSVLDIRQAGYDTYVVADASGSRTADNAALALERMRDAGVGVVSSEMVIFEWMRRADRDCFKELSALIK